MNVFTNRRPIYSYNYNDIIESFKWSINEIIISYNGEITNCLELLESKTFSKNKLLIDYSKFRNDMLRYSSNDGLIEIISEVNEWTTLINKQALRSFINTSIEIEKQLVKIEARRRINKNILPKYLQLEVLLKLR